MDKLNILWTTDDKETFLNMIAMYSNNALKKGWWEEINILIWGGSTKLALDDQEVQDRIVELIDSGVSVEACRACAAEYGASQALKQLGVNVRYTGTILTDYIKSDVKLLTI
ncbi:MAG: DsrE family protein [Candidatus Marinimicrobia bacterium]|jgi:hypothetical protein|nr:DsrE family protein [Candidatus Neomarinimicrobiota bacterium]MBT3679456.1 DsrE family protein [Candidatus Neomarinimicrobiota bacterium]MBT3951075.1 DsrE family protein [Candidatus Neomarinimicrobiota bacterium]MBT4254245.1 DsrE family protein [Candidatus Neomarinimicrobiota bacterium]MBT4479426.1 DsrE family protein [Candidatus Neomarinimicrobiota bacterium]